MYIPPTLREKYINKIRTHKQVGNNSPQDTEVLR